MSKPAIAVAADAVVAELNSRTWSQAFKATRAFVFRYKPEEWKTLRVTVMISDSDQKLVTRGVRQRMHEIDIGFGKDVDPTNVAAIDSLLGLVEEVSDWYGANTVNGRRKIDGVNAWVTETNIFPLYSPQDLDTNSRFISVLTLTVLGQENV